MKKCELLHSFEPGLTDPELKPGRVKKKIEKVMIQCNPADLAG
jgi:hypothetical protein